VLITTFECLETAMQWRMGGGGGYEEGKLKVGAVVVHAEDLNTQVHVRGRGGREDDAVIESGHVQACRDHQQLCRLLRCASLCFVAWCCLCFVAWCCLCFVAWCCLSLLSLLSCLILARLGP
jgi:hypothetical protein